MENKMIREGLVHIRPKKDFSSLYESKFLLIFDSPRQRKIRESKWIDSVRVQLVSDIKRFRIFIY